MDTRDPIEVQYAPCWCCAATTQDTIGYLWRLIFGSSKLATIDWHLLIEAAWSDHETVCDSHPTFCFVLFRINYLQDYVGRSFPRSFQQLTKSPLLLLTNFYTLTLSTMASSLSLSPKLFTRDLAACTDAELNEYLDVNGGLRYPEYYSLYSC